MPDSQDGKKLGPPTNPVIVTDAMRAADRDKPQSPLARLGNIVAGIVILLAVLFWVLLRSGLLFKIFDWLS